MFLVSCPPSAPALSLGMSEVTQAVAVLPSGVRGCVTLVSRGHLAHRTAVSSAGWDSEAASLRDACVYGMDQRDP